jgi:hypothetical protein
MVQFNPSSTSPDPVGSQALGGIAEGLINFFNQRTDDQRQKQQAQMQAQMEMQKQNFLMRKQKEHDMAIEGFRANAQAQNTQRIIDNQNRMQKNSLATQDMRNETITDREVQRQLSGLLGEKIVENPVTGAINILNPSSVEPKTQAKLRTILKVKQFDKPGMQNKSRQIISSGFGIDDPDTINKIYANIQRMNDDDLGEYVKSQKVTPIESIISTYKAKQAGTKSLTSGDLKVIDRGQPSYSGFENVRDEDLKEIDNLGGGDNAH